MNNAENLAKDPERLARTIAAHDCPPNGTDCSGERYCWKCWSDWLKQDASEEKPAENAEHPSCILCQNRRDEVVDDFPVSYCPYYGETPISKPWETVCDSYARGGAAK